MTLKLCSLSFVLVCHILARNGRLTYYVVNRPRFLCDYKSKKTIVALNDNYENKIKSSHITYFYITSKLILTIIIICFKMSKIYFDHYSTLSPYHWLRIEAHFHENVINRLFFATLNSFGTPR